MSFLDVIACGLGAVVLLFIIITHATQVRSSDLNSDFLIQVERLELEILLEQRSIDEMNTSLQQTEQTLEETRGISTRLSIAIEKTKAELADLTEHSAQQQRTISTLTTELQTIEQDLRIFDEGQAPATREFTGEGDRQYLTGLKVGGERILIFVDTSASMLDDNVVNIIRRRHLPVEHKLDSNKWKRAIATVDWLTTQIPLTSKFQIYEFNTKAKPLIVNTTGRWLEVNDGTLLNEAVDKLKKLVPKGGTSLYNAFAAISQMNPKPDNVFLITDGLPTQSGSAPLARKISGRQRIRHFSNAVKQLPAGIPVNTILFAIEGDPRAASAYWQLAQRTRGSLISPSADWPR